jgi:DNA (cytosine-5)-methyltransferase 1
MRPPIIRLGLDDMIADNFAGGGGVSTGIEAALGGRGPDVAINHDPRALAMHRANHPRTHHVESGIWEVDPRTVTGGRRVRLAWFSPDCTHFSRAKGDVPKKQEIRGLPWVAVKWAREVQPGEIVIENVSEIETWGPLDEEGRPIRERAGETWRAFLGALSDLGYQIDVRKLCAADYGAPTTRTRLFLRASRNRRQPIRWPEPTHGKGRAEPWRLAAEIIDWTLPCPSIFLSPEEARALGVKRPLADATLRRVAAGLWRFVINNPAPFVIKYHGGERQGLRAHALSEPLRTADTSNRFGLVMPYLAPLTHHGGPGTGRGERGASVEEPLRAVTGAHRGEWALVAPALVQTGYGEREGQAPRVLDIGRPLGTVVACGAKHALVAAFLAKHYGGMTGHGLQRSIGTITARDHHSLVEATLAPFVAKLYGTSTASGCAEPVPTVTAGGGHLAEVAAFLVRYNGAGGRADQHAPLGQPLGTVLTHDHFALVMVEGEPHAIVDIGLRMLQPRELFSAQGFPLEYIIDPIGPSGKPLNKTDAIHLAGNAVPVQLAEAVVRECLAA